MYFLFHFIPFNSKSNANQIKIHFFSSLKMYFKTKFANKTNLKTNSKLNERVILHLFGLNLSHFSKSISNKEMHIINGNIFNKLRIAHQNIRGGLYYKMNEIEILFDKFQSDILGISEANYSPMNPIETNNINYNLIPGLNYSKNYTRLVVFVKKRA